LESLDELRTDAGQVLQVTAELGEGRLIAVGHGAHAVEVQLFQVAQQLIGQPPRFRQPGESALPALPLRLPNFSVGASQWSDHLVAPFR
jgi:hypothetical protein